MGGQDGSVRPQSPLYLSAAQTISVPRSACQPPLNPAWEKDWGGVETTREEAMEPSIRPSPSTHQIHPSSQQATAPHFPPLWALVPPPWLTVPLAAPGDRPTPVLSLEGTKCDHQASLPTWRPGGRRKPGNSQAKLTRLAGSQFPLFYLMGPHLPQSPLHQEGTPGSWTPPR